MHDKEVQVAISPRIFNPAYNIYDNRGEKEPLLLSHYSSHQQHPRYYQNVADIGVHVLPSAPHRPQRPTSPPSGAEWQPMLTKQKEDLSTNWCGVFLAFLSGTFFTLSSAAVKGLKSIDPMELLLIRSIVQILVMIPIAIKNGENLIGPKGYRLLLQLQGAVGGATLVLLFFSFRRLPLGDATTIIFSSPVFVMVLSFIILREPCGFYRTLIVFMLLTGVVLISKPPFIFRTGNDTYDVIGYSCAVLATLFTALNIVVMRKCKDVHYSVVVLQLSLWSFFLSLILLLTLSQHPPITMTRLVDREWSEWAKAVGVSILGLSGQVLVARALSLEGAGKVAVTRSLDIVLAFILQVTVFREIPDWMSILGAILVLVCVLGMGLEEQVQYLASLVP